MTWSARLLMLRPADRPVMKNRSGWARKTSSVLRPMEPVDPRMAMPFLAECDIAGCDAPLHGVVEEGRRENQRIQPIQYAAVPRDDAG